jgi:nucleotide-binding universal stress UspA family protein
VSSRTIVVGVDGSPASRIAVLWGAEEARLRGATLRAVHAWEAPLSVSAPEPIIGGFPIIPELEPGEVRESYEAAGERLLDEGLAGVEGVEIERMVVDGPPAATLVDISRDADMLVVGSHHRGRVADLVLGSVSKACVQHASCPVVVIPAPVE